jgi:hypothetical protein
MRSFRFVAAIVCLAWFSGATAAQAAVNAVMYKDPNCGCCEEYAKYLREHGINVEIIPTADLTPIKQRYHVPEDMEGCHTVIVDGYAIEGHVPIAAVRKLLAEKPKVAGISLPGMPAGSPGMSGKKSEPFAIYAFTSGAPRVFATE